MEKIAELELGGKILKLETGELAKQADGAVLAQYGETAVLATVVIGEENKDSIDFFPLTIEYRERTYAAGKIPGGFFKREGRPREKEILTSRLIDRPLRPLFPSGFKNEIQISVTVLSVDQENDPDVISIIAASSALSISGLNFVQPIAAVRVGRISNEFVVNPTFSQLTLSDLDLVVAGSEEAVIMLEGGSNQITEAEILEAIKFAHLNIKQIVAVEKQLIDKVKPVRRSFTLTLPEEKMVQEVKKFSEENIKENLTFTDKKARQENYNLILNNALEHFKEIYPEQETNIKQILQDLSKKEVRRLISEKSKRVDSRKLDEIRQITAKVGIFPRTHGSSLFTRGQTQAFVATTLGTMADMQIMDELEGEYKKKFMLHYNFPPFATGEVKPQRGPGRREIGHGALAERALKPVLPLEEDFPYTIRIVSDILESNGSSSMASVCGGSLALMDAGVPITSPVAGIAMGVIVENNKNYILSDISGIEDHCGDMDFKVAGTTKGITAIQLDLKIEGLSYEILENALQQAKIGRLFILDKLNQVISSPRENLSVYAPKIALMQINPEKIKNVIGPGGKVIKKIIEDTGAEIDIEEDGKVYIAGPSQDAVDSAQAMIEYFIADAEVGKIYKGKVTRIVNFGAFVEILPGKEGLVHISQLDEKRVERVEDIVKEGEEIIVKVIEIDNLGRINLSRKQALRESRREP